MREGWKVGKVEGGRREFLRLGAAGLLSILPTFSLSTGQSPDSLPGTGPAGRLWDPSRAGRPLPPVTAADNDAAIQVIEKQLHCTCGCNQDVYTCRTTDFTCTTSPAMHRRVVALAEAGKTGPQILDEFVRENGVAILMSPPRRGFNLAAYFVPSLLIVGAGVVLTIAMRRWSRAAAPLPAPPAPPAPSAPFAPPAPATAAPLYGVAASPEELERLRRELDRLSV